MEKFWEKVDKDRQWGGIVNTMPCCRPPLVPNETKTPGAKNNPPVTGFEPPSFEYQKSNGWDRSHGPPQVPASGMVPEEVCKRRSSCA